MFSPNEIKKLRIQLNMSQEELAQHLGVSFSTINRLETGKSKPSKLAIQSLITFCEKNNIITELS